MMLRRLFVPAAIASLCLPVAVQAQYDPVVITQDSCVAVGPNQVRVYFSLTNYSPDYETLCWFTLNPDPSPASDACWINDAGAPFPWATSDITQTGGMWFSAAPTEWTQGCIHGAETVGEFYITIDPNGDCCYTAEFFNHLYVQWYSATWCISSCYPVPTENSTWGSIKQKYD